MNRLTQIVLLAVVLIVLAPVQAGLKVGDVNACQVFAADDSGKGKSGKEKEEEAEPECD